MSKESFVEPSGKAVVGHAHEEAGSRRPKDVNCGVVLPLVALDGVEDAAAAEGVAVSVDESARSAGVLEAVAAAVGAYLRLQGCRIGVRLGIGDERLEPARRHLNVRIEQDGVFGRNLLECAIIASGKPGIVGHRNDAHGGEFRAKHGERLIGRAVVGDHHFGQCRRRVGYDGGEELAEQGGAVPVEDYD
jgi:hypothetical protein